ncbi:MAG: ABC transporter substrate-binding protein [Anaerolineae bacterium]|nr:ABC transporter substrate-binding protein [Anaerolineae bacterium]
MRINHWGRYTILLLICLSFVITPLASAQDGVTPPVAYPDPPDLEIGGGEINRLPISELVTYMALPEYHQAPWLDALVEAGELPPVEERLPKEPQVYLEASMEDGLGVYGDVWRGFSACPTAGYNDLAGTTMGWFGIESYTTRYQGLIKTGPLYRADQDIEPFPNLAKSWEWSEDGKQLTIHLIEGAYWSDGEPFTADDVIFTWEGYVVDENVNSPRHLDAWTWEGEAASLEKVDDYTIMFTFPVEKPLDMWYLLAEDIFHVMPAHQLQSLHPKWSTADPAPSYKDFADALAPDNLPLVTMGPWVITEYITDELMIMRRNPYYWKVDAAGNQLPYIDEIQYRKGPSGIGRDLCTIAGDCDQMNLENPSTFVEAMVQAQEEDAPYAVTWGPETLGYYVQFNYALHVGIEDTDRDVAVRELFRDLRFRQALSYATDREGIAQSIMRGPFLRAWAGGLYPGAPDFDKESVVYYPYDVNSANILLDEIGLMDTNGDGVREWTEGPMAGEPVVLQLLASQDAAETQSVAEALVNLWGEVGIQINLRIMDSATHTDVDNAGTWDMSVTRGGQSFALPFRGVTDMAPIAANFVWHREGSEPRELLDFEQQLVDIITEYRSTYDAEGRRELMFQYNQIFTENVYNLGVFVGRYGLGQAKRVQNVAEGTPVFLYQWVEDAILLDTLWTPIDQQKEQVRPGTIPVYGE